jgi:hypothetical protein
LPQRARTRTLRQTLTRWGWCDGQVQFKRRESERAQAARKRSHAYLQKQVDDEPWVALTYHDDQVPALCPLSPMGGKSVDDR